MCVLLLNAIQHVVRRISLLFILFNSSNGYQWKADEKFYIFGSGFNKIGRSVRRENHENCRQFGPLEAIECNSLKLSTFTSAKDVGLVKPTEVSGAAKGKRWRPGSGESN